MDAIKNVVGGMAQAAGMTGAGVYNGGSGMHALAPGDYNVMNGGKRQRRSRGGGVFPVTLANGGGRSRRLKRVSGKARHRRTKSITVGGKRRGHRHTRKCKCSRKRKY